MSGYHFGGERARAMAERMRAIRQRGKARPLMRGAAVCAELGNAVCADMADWDDAQTIDVFAELLCGGADPARALTPAEAARYLGKDTAYGRALLARLIKRSGRDPGPDKGVRPER